MSRFFVLFIIAVLSVAAVASAQTAAQKKKHKAQVKVVQPQPEPAAAAPQPAPPPPTPEQGPSSPPDVSFQNGELTIVARNSTMGDVLTAVKQKTGAAVEMPAVSSERVVGRFGPGAPRDVLAQLLNGSHYDYVLLGSPADPGALKKVVLMARASGPEPAPQQPGGPPQNMMGNSQVLQAVPEVENDQSPEETSGEVPAEIQQPEQQEEPPPDQQQPGQNGPVVKTPEQLLRELQQQQQQQQNGQPGAPGQPPQ
jgi:hypothetical protein